jgi:phage shock protein C
VNPRRVYRSADDRWIAGVAAGVAEYFDVDPILVRVIWIVSCVPLVFLPVIAYVIMVVVVPLAPQEWPEPSPWQPGGAPLGYSATFTSPAAPAADAAATTAGPAPEAGAAAPEAATGAATGAPGAPQGAVPPPGPVPGGDWRWQGRQDRWQRRAERWQRKAERREQRGERHGSGGIVFGALLIVIGGLFAWHEIDPRLDLSLAWPVAIIVFGIFLVVSSVGWRRGE